MRFHDNSILDLSLQLEKWIKGISIVNFSRLFFIKSFYYTVITCKLHFIEFSGPTEQMRVGLNCGMKLIPVSGVLLEIVAKSSWQALQRSQECVQIKLELNDKFKLRRNKKLRVEFSFEVV